MDVEPGSTDMWIGAELTVMDRHVIKAALPQKFIDELKVELRKLQDMKVVKLELLRRVAGRGSCATGIAPATRNFLQPLWATMGSVARADRQ